MDIVLPEEPMRVSLVGYDPASLSDWSAISVIQTDLAQSGSRSHCLTHLERFPMGTSYPDQVARVKELMVELQKAGDTWLVIDSTGLGRPILDYLRNSGFPKQNVLGISITGGTAIGRDQCGYTIPKRDLVSNAVVVLQSGKLKIAENLPLLSEMVQEMMNFKIKVSPRGHDSYEAWRESDHDDLVLATCLALWCGENVRERQKPRLIDSRGNVVDL